MLTNRMHISARAPQALYATAMVVVVSAMVAVRPSDAGAQILKKLKDKATQIVGGAAADSAAAKADSIAKTGSKISQAASKLTTATDAIQQKTGTSKQAIVGAALSASGAGVVGTALQAGSGSDKASAGLSAAKAVVGAVNALGVNGRGADPCGGVDAVGSQMEAAWLQQQLRWLETAANDSTQPPMMRLTARQQLDLYRLSLRAQQGDTAAMRALTAAQRGASGSKPPRTP